MTQSRIVLFFEDTDAIAEEIMHLLGPQLGNFAEIARFVPSQYPDLPQTFESRLERAIAEKTAAGKTVVFVLSDMDLSRTAQFSGLSDSNVRKVASKLGLPSAFYSSNLQGEEFIKANQAGDGRILLDRSDLAVLSHDVNCLVRGFARINDSLLQIKSRPLDERPRNAAAFLAELLGRPELEHRIKLFISGDQRMGAELLASPDHSLGRQGALFGTWIYDSLLKYPGLTVNEVAAASYLNISQVDFARAEVRQCFKQAVFNGPFYSDTQTLWWRDMLDEMLLESDVEDGKDFVKARENLDVNPCMCSVIESEQAGFYCMITKRPVSEAGSVGGINWFPPGADLARISNSRYEELAPWMDL